MNENYSMWKINSNDFFSLNTDYERMYFFLSFALLAPSGHNSQPWKFVVNNNVVDVFFENKRVVCDSDERGRQMFISLGCFVANFSEAVHAYGYNCVITYNSKLKIDSPESLVRLSFYIKNDSLKSNLSVLDLIKHRCTDRNKYVNKELPENILKIIADYNDESLKISIVQDKKVKSLLADYSVNAQIEIMDRSSFRNELSNFIKNTLTFSKYGMTGNTLCLPLIASFFASKLISKFNLSKFTKKNDYLLLNEFTPYFLYISTLEDNPHSWVKTGEVLEKIWLEFTSYSISCHPLAAIIQNSTYRAKLISELKTDFFPNVFIRVGFSELKLSQIPHSPRFLIKDLIV